MSTRKLTKQQQTRIQTLQRKRSQSSKLSLLDGEESLGPARSGLVISHHGTSIIVESDAEKLFRCVVRQNLGAIVCGDRVIWQQINEEEGVIISLQERKTLLQRPDYSGKPKPVVANIDQIIVVCAVQPELSEHLIDRYLVIEEMTGIEAAILVNKIDLCSGDELEAVHERMSVYEKIGYRVIYTSVKGEHGLDPIILQLSGKSSILVGQSGVGKSSLVKTLLPDLDIRIGELNQATHGKHTTTTSMLYHLPTGGIIIDSPGVRDFAIWHIEPDKIAAGFREFREYEGMCRFSNCRHVSEPDCAIQKAVEQGEISRRRFESYLQMLQETESGNRA